MVRTLTLGLHLITERVGLCKPAELYRVIYAHDNVLSYNQLPNPSDTPTHPTIYIY